MRLITLIQEKKYAEALAFAQQSNANLKDSFLSSQSGSNSSLDFSKWITTVFDDALSTGVKEAEAVLALLTLKDCEELSNSFSDFYTYIGKLLAEENDTELLQKMWRFMQISHLEKVNILVTSHRFGSGMIFAYKLQTNLYTWALQNKKGIVESKENEEHLPTSMTNVTTRLRWILKFPKYVDLSQRLKPCLYSLYDLPGILKIFPEPTGLDSKLYHDFFHQLVQLRQNHLLAHRFGIDYEFSDFSSFTGLDQSGIGQPVEFQGADEDVMIEEVIRSFSQFSQDPSSLEALKRIQEKCQIKQNGKAILTDILSDLKSGFMQDKKKTLEKVNTSDPLLMPVVTENNTDDAHVFVCGMMQNLLVVGDRGRQKAGFTVYELPETAKKEEFISALLEFNQDQKSNEEQFTLLLEKTLEIKTPFMHFKRAPQFSGTCAFASCAKPGLQIAIFFRFFALIQQNFSNQPTKNLVQLAMSAATHLFKAWVSYDLPQFLQGYLTQLLLLKPSVAKETHTDVLLGMVFLKYQHRIHRRALSDLANKTGFLTEDVLQTAQKRFQKLWLEILTEGYCRRLKLDPDDNPRIHNIQYWANRLMSIHFQQDKKELRYWLNHLRASLVLKVGMEKNDTAKIEQALERIKDLNAPALGSELSFLEKACEAGNLPLMKTLIAKGASPITTSQKESKENQEKHSNLFCIAVKKGHIHILRFLLTLIPECVNCKNEHGKPESALTIACNNNQFETVQLLVENGAKVSEWKENQESSISYDDIIGNIIERTQDVPRTKEVERDQVALLKLLIPYAKLNEKRREAYLETARLNGLVAEGLAFLQDFPISGASVTVTATAELPIVAPLILSGMQVAAAAGEGIGATPPVSTLKLASNS